jgi:VIT1/CCC1 family predicted Fe2+/Mn2+ transporter
MSMAAGEYVSVHSQADVEKADLEKEKKELLLSPEHELQELAGIYMDRGVNREVSFEVAKQLTAHDALGAHARDELGISEIMSARPIQAAVFSAVSFAIGAALPLGVTALYYGPMMIPVISLCSLLFLALLGAVAARAGGASILTGSLRVLFWGAMAMGATAVVGKLFGGVVA